MYLRNLTLLWFGEYRVCCCHIRAVCGWCRACKYDEIAKTGGLIGKIGVDSVAGVDSMAKSEEVPKAGAVDVQAIQ